jgi:hypothetical protein
MSKGGTITDLESSMSAISSAVGKWAINLEKTCINLAAKYENQNEKQHYAPDDDELSKNLKTEFKNQSTTSFSIDKIIFWLLLILLIVLLATMVHKFRKSS